MSDPVPDLPLAPARRSLWDRVSLVWLVPIVALLVALAVAWRSYAGAGPLVTITFDDAAGVVARETELRFRNVAVGVVERVQFTPGLDQVVVSVRLDPEVAPYVDEGASFWVVRPRITTQSITGIETVLSGVFIEGVWDNQPGEETRAFVGREDAPLLRAGQQGLEFTLFSTDGTLTSASALLYQGVVVGATGEPRLAQDGQSVEAEAVVYAPYDTLVTDRTRFYDASGFRLSVGSAGADVDFDSLGALLQGGLAFEDFESGGGPVEDGARIRAYYSEDLARDTLAADPGTPSLELTVVFDGGPIAGLAQDASVELQGLRVGSVTAVRTLLDPARFGDEDIHLQATLALQPSRLGLEGEEGREEVLDWLSDRVAEGLRARLATASLLGGLKVELVTVADAPPATLDATAEPFPVLPVTGANITDFGDTAQGLLDRVDNLRIEELLASATAFLDNAGVLIGNEDTQAVPGDLRALLADIRGVTGSDEVQALPADVQAALAQIDGAAADLRALLAQLDEQRGVERVLAAVDRAGATADAVAAAVDATAEGLPALVARLDALAAKAEALAVEPLLAEVTGLSADARALLAQPGVQDLTGNLASLTFQANEVLAQARDILAEVDEVGLASRLASAITSAEEAAQGVEASFEGVPPLIARIDALAAKANDLALEDLVNELASLAASADAFVSAPGTQAIPEDLASTLAELEAILREAREANVIGNVNATLTTARSAAESLPALVARAGGLLDQASATLSNFDQTSGLVREAQSAIRDVAAAADAIASLARAIERNPNSLIFGD